jgi:hypothetical protein
MDHSLSPLHCDTIKCRNVFDTLLAGKSAGYVTGFKNGYREAVNQQVPEKDLRMTWASGFKALCKIVASFTYMHVDALCMDEKPSSSRTGQYIEGCKAGAESAKLTYRGVIDYLNAKSWDKHEPWVANTEIRIRIEKMLDDREKAEVARLAAASQKK